MNPRHRATMGLIALVALRAGSDVWRLLVEPWRYSDWEDAYNATEAALLWHGHLWAQALQMQYLSFCGGCTVVSALGAPLLGVFGDRFLAWKAVAVAWNAATLLAGWVAVDRWAGRSAAWCAALLLALPVPGLQDASLMLWGNHAATTLWVLGALALAAGPRARATGLVVGLGVWFCRTAAVGALVVGALALARPGRRARFLTGLALGLAPCALPAAGGDAGTYDFGRGMWLPDGLPGALERLGGLLDPARLGALAAEARGGGAVGAGLLLGAGLATAMAVADRAPRRLVFAALCVAFAGAVALTGFAPTASLHPAALKGATRILAPWFAALALATAAGAGPALARPGWRRWGAAVAVGVPLLAAIAAQAPRLSSARPAPSVLDMPASEHGRFAVVWAPRSTDTALPASSNPVVGAALRRVEGWRIATALRLGSISEDQALARAAARPGARARLYGLGQALVGESWREDEVLAAAHRASALPPSEGAALGRGEGMALGARWSGQPDALADLLSQAGSPCYLCAAVGWLAVQRCAPGLPRGTPQVADCAASALTGAPDPVEAAWGAGLAAEGVDAGEVLAGILETRMPQPQAAAFQAGLRDPLARISSSSGPPALPITADR